MSRSKWRSKHVPGESPGRQSSVQREEGLLRGVLEARGCMVLSGTSGSWGVQSVGNC